MLNFKGIDMNFYINKRGEAVHTSLDIKKIAEGCCVPCSATVMREGEMLCDFPLKNGNSCDSFLCNSHAYKIAENVRFHTTDGNVVDDIHLCPAHYDEWKRFGERKFWEDGM